MFKHDKPTERENALLLFSGKQPEWVPIASDCFIGGMHTFFFKTMQPIVRPETRADWRDHEFIDLFGIDMVQPDQNIGAMPNNEHWLVSDITKWREQIKPFPDLSKMDWEDMAAGDMAHVTEEARHERIVQSMMWYPAGIPYNHIVSCMGHEDTLAAMLEEPEAFFEFANYITDWNVELIKYTAKYYKPDQIVFCEDLATKLGTFMSPATYRELIKPCHKRLVDAIAECGIIPSMHCCGKPETIVGDFVDIGIRSWNPVQLCNDVTKIKAEFGNTLVLDGGVDTQGPMNRIGASEEEVRESVRHSMDVCAPGGGYIFDTSGMVLEYKVGKQHVDWIYDEAKSYGREFYRTK